MKERKKVALNRAHVNINKYVYIYVLWIQANRNSKKAEANIACNLFSIEQVSCVSLSCFLYALNQKKNQKPKFKNKQKLIDYVSPLK